MKKKKNATDGRPRVSPALSDAPLKLDPINVPRGNPSGPTACAHAGLLDRGDRQEAPCPE
ncbi:MAG: hypothetical protein NTNFB02_26560 [Nitrospira sp.]